jgi:hypothetical protein
MIGEASLLDDLKVDSVREAEGVVEGLLRVGLTARYFRSADGRVHAQVPFGDRLEIYGLNSAAFRDWLFESYRRDRGEVPSLASISRAAAAIEARARFDGGMPAIYVRVGRDGEGSGADIYLDLGDSAGRAVKINAREWEVVARPPIHFRRPGGLLPLQEPSHDGWIELLRSYVNVSEPEFRLLIGWMAAALLPEGPYPILAIHGEQGSAKSTLARVIRGLIDPQASPLLAEPRSTRDLIVTARSGWLLAYDNISELPDWLSDSLCRLATGGGFAGRALYSDDERNVIEAQRPVILNGIDEFVRRDDLADRCVFLRLAPIKATDRRAEGEFWESFREDYPAILGGLLDAVVGGLRELRTLELTELPRMADFARFGEAVGRGLGWPADTFLSAYSDNRHERTETALEESVLATLLLKYADYGGLVNWTLPPTEMLKQLAADVNPRIRASARWLKSPMTFASELRRIAPHLRTQGISVEFTRTCKSRMVTINADRKFGHSDSAQHSNLCEAQDAD